MINPESGTDKPKPRRRWLIKTRRVVFNVICLISALLCLATIVFGVRGFWKMDAVWLGQRYPTPHEDRSYAFATTSGQGALSFLILRGQFIVSTDNVVQTFKLPNPSGFHWGYRPLDGSFSVAGVYTFQVIHRHETTVGLEYWLLNAPSWIVALSFAILPCLWVWLYYQRKRHRPGYCIQCGYDLRASGGNCPECGAVIPASQSAPSV